MSEVFSARVDIRDLATLAKIFDSEGIKFTSRSNLISVAVGYAAETLSSALQNEYPETLKFESTHEAEEYLNEDPRIKLKEKTIKGSVEQKRKEARSGLKQSQFAERETDEEIEKRAQELRETLQELQNENNEQRTDERR